MGTCGAGGVQTEVAVIVVVVVMVEVVGVVEVVGLVGVRCILWGWGDKHGAR